MNIPKYWIKESQDLADVSGRPFLAQCWGWSNISNGEARKRARDAIEEITRKIRNNERLDRYSYGKRPLREEIVESITNGKNKLVAVITRNGYGALILNTTRVMFVDIDFEPEGLIEKMTFSIRKLLGQPILAQQDKHIQRLNLWMRANPRWEMCVYRTKAGLRCLVTHDTFDPSLTSTIEVLESLGADPLYVTLCKNQESFRARLTPKPWRCGLGNPPNRYPWDSEPEEQKFRRWEEGYQHAISSFTTCQLISEVSQIRQHPEVTMIKALHDRYACINDNFRLA